MKRFCSVQFSLWQLIHFSSFLNCYYFFFFFFSFYVGCSVGPLQYLRCSSGGCRGGWSRWEIFFFFFASAVKRSPSPSTGLRFSVLPRVRSRFFRTRIVMDFFFFPFPSCRQVSVSIEICTIVTQVSHTLRCNTSWLRFSVRKLGLEIFTPLSARCCECVFDFNASNCKMMRRERKEVCFGTRLVASVLLCGRCWCSELMRLKKKISSTSGTYKISFLTGKNKIGDSAPTTGPVLLCFLFWCLSSAVARGGRFCEVWCN